MMEGINALVFSTADNPFYKLSVSKYAPECVVLDADGTVLAIINRTNKKDDVLQLTYGDDFRDPDLKINDDKKIRIALSAVKKPGISIFLLIRELDTTGKPVKDSDFDRAWFRISNEETNQTLDYSLISKVDKPEDYQPTFVKEGDEEGTAHPNPLTYLHGRIYLDESNNWAFESLKKVFQQKDQPNLVQTLSTLYGKTMEEVSE